MAKHIQFNSWNRYAKRFVRPPIFTWDPVDNAVTYRIGVAATSQRHATWFETDRPTFDFGPLWGQLPFERIDMITLPLDAAGREADKPWYDDNMAYKSFYKSPGWQGGQHIPLDWVGTIRRNMAYLLRPATDRVEPFEEGLPRHVWSATEDSYTGERHFGGIPGAMNSYPTLHFPFYISAFLNFAQAYPGDPLATEARRQALQYGDWLLQNHHPFEYACSGFPYSCIAKGELKEHSPTGKNNITVFRVAAVGEVMLYLGDVVGHRDHTRYALHLADGLLRLQKDDGSWPFRVEAETGAVVEEYTSDVVTPARLMALLYSKTGDERYKKARDRAIEWLFQNPIRTFRWEGMYEDVAGQKPYFNLQHWDVDEAIRYLIYFKDEITDAVSVAQRLNDYVEDQFVIWQMGDPVVQVQCPAPAVLEQYLCYEPMEGHTARWILSLVALHSATGDPAYLSKAIAAANAICQQQTPSGSFTTWGYDERFQRPLRKQYDWFGVDALAVKGLMMLDAYVKSHEKEEPFSLALNECY
jgi:hypothetical protein